MFTKTVISMTKDDGSNTSEVLQSLFLAMDTSADERGGLSEYARKFPYVNGGLFRDRMHVPHFSRRARRLLKECGDLAWQEINPDIFGSMIQAIVEPGLRGDLGMHYTSVPNIMKVLRPLFLISLEEEFEAAENNKTKLIKLRDRLYDIRVFDPACGSGNFLIIAYRELRKIENRIFARLKELTTQAPLPMSGIRLSQFYGIEIADFAAETAKLSLWISDYQMNEQFKAMFGSAPPALPLRESGNITHGNATRIDWLEVCPKNQGTEIYVVGNPPYLGGKKLNETQSDDMDIAGLGNMKQLDYIGCFFVKAAKYIEKTTYQFSFVTTSSICQGEQVHLLWPYIFEKGLEISFAYEPFKWTNNAKDNAVVSCTVIGVKSNTVKRDKWIFSDSHARIVKNVSPYLIDGSNIYVTPSTSVINRMPPMCMGSNPVDGKHLILSKSEYLSTISDYPSSKKFIKKYMGGDDFINGIERYCLWIEEHDLADAMKIPFISKRLKECEKYRRGAGRDARKVANKPYRFCYKTHQEAAAIIYPNTSAASRLYIPAGFTDQMTIINKDAFAIYNPEPFAFAVLSSTMHRVWLAAAGGRGMSRSMLKLEGRRCSP